MNKTIVRSRIAGSFSAVASLVILDSGSSALASGGGCDPIYTDYGDGVAYPDFCEDTFVAPLFPIDLIPMPIGVDLIPSLCTPLDLANLEVRAAQTGPDNWQWRYEINGDTSFLCDTWLDAEVWHPEVGMAMVQTFYVSDIVEANNLGEDYIVEFDLPCAYDTSTHFGPTRILLDEYLDQIQYGSDCADPAIGDELIGELEELPVHTTPDTTADTTPDTTPTDPAADSDAPVLVDTAEVEDAPVTIDTATVPTEIPQTPRTPNEPELPRTGSDSTPLVIGAGLVVLGLGLGFTAVSMTRKRRLA